MTNARSLKTPGTKRRRICFVTGTRAEFGLMQTTLSAIRDHPSLILQIIATGMHLSAAHGRSVNTIRRAGWKVDATVAWPTSDEEQNAVQTGRAMAGIAAALGRLETDIVLVVGDRVEAFAAAAAGHIGGHIVAHVHGGDRALGQVDDSLRHAITKLAHIHFPATKQSAHRIKKLGEDPWRIHLVGSPGIGGIADQAEKAHTNLGRFALVLLHPTDTDEAVEQKRAKLVLTCVRQIGFDNVVIIYPNNDPGSAGIIRCWEKEVKNEIVFRDTQRPRFLALLCDAAVLIGNSSSGIIEAASFRTPVVDIGPRQQGRQRSANVVNVPFAKSKIAGELRRIWNQGKPIRSKVKNIYGSNGAGGRIAEALAMTHIDSTQRRKLIAY
jgi:UDP-N-acetylglucosamine 2-epimerase (non-hydrolysing)/GDP/UDP-N,N'-diacetylbacillosamine 2-epimerase (hydrolysing)